MTSIFGIHEQALRIEAKRAEILASNMANADTPGFKARDLDFKAILQSNMDNQSMSGMTTTNSVHLAGQPTADTMQLKYRTALQDSFDGNTVDTHIEQAQYSENAMHYMTTLNFINGRAQTIMNALKGE